MASMYTSDILKLIAQLQARCNSLSMALKLDNNVMVTEMSARIARIEAALAQQAASELTSGATWASLSEARDTALARGDLQEVAVIERLLALLQQSAAGTFAGTSANTSAGSRAPRCVQLLLQLQRHICEIEGEKAANEALLIDQIAQHTLRTESIGELDMCSLVDSCTCKICFDLYTDPVSRRTQADAHKLHTGCLNWVVKLHARWRKVRALERGSLRTGSCLKLCCLLATHVCRFCLPRLATPTVERASPDGTTREARIR